MVYYARSLDMATCTYLEVVVLSVPTHPLGYQFIKDVQTFTQCPNTFAVKDIYRISIGAETSDYRSTNIGISGMTFFYDYYLSEIEWWNGMLKQSILLMVVVFDKKEQLTTLTAAQVYSYDTNTSLDNPRFNLTSQTISFTGTSKPLILEPQIPFNDIVIVMWIRFFGSVTEDRTV
eukprot:TRINITY_DN13466_c0_g2_i1.p3 TRINITY_DN13466_c0_g2~~TRINITY_DN13466_c0_g2_i1.p3  ORF type:complete len:176 (+),score=21.27 TRINITY_DN13466_c0_g2_i1:481-1008(+)